MSLRHSRAKYLLAVSLSPAKYLGYRNFPGNRNSPNGDAYPLFPPATVLCLCALCENGSGEEKRTRVMSHRDWYFFRILTSMKIILEFVRIGFLLISILLFLGINSIQLRVTSTLIDCLNSTKKRIISLSQNWLWNAVSYLEPCLNSPLEMTSSNKVGFNLCSTLVWCWEELWSGTHK